MLQNKLHGFVGRFAIAFFDYWSETLSNGSVNSKRALRSPPGNCHFVLEKLQMPHGRTWHSNKNLTVWGLKKVCKRPTSGQHQNNRPLPGCKNPHFQNVARCTTFLVKTSFICMRMKNDFHIKDWAPTLVLRQRHGGTQKWPTIAFLTPKWCSILKAITSYFDVKGVHSALVWNWNFLTSLPGLFACPVGDEALRVFQELGQCVYWFSKTVKEW